MRLTLCVFGLLLLLMNKPFGELCRRHQIVDYGIWSFRLPLIIIGAFLLLLGVSLFLF